MPQNPSTGQSLQTEEQMEQIHTAIERAKEYAAEQAKEADRLVREYPYQALGIAFGVGLLIGLLASRR
jgi:ElaB/YqjD/DUF883 family membrane-anchored ribosome-binding protein